MRLALIVKAAYWLAVAVWALGCADLPPAQAAAITEPAITCVARQLKAAEDNRADGGDCPAAIAAIVVVLATDPDCIASKTTDSHYTCKPKRDGGTDAH